MAAAEMMEHDIKCSVCRSPTIIGFRYKCLQCTNFNMCQECYWSGKTAKDHDRTRHFMEEYCITPDERGLFFRTLGNRGRKKSVRNRAHPTDQSGYVSQESSPTSKTNPHTMSLKRDLSASFSSLSSSSLSSSLPNETVSHLAEDDSFSYGTIAPAFDETQMLKKLRHDQIRNQLSSSQSFDYGRKHNVIDTTPPPPLPPRNLIKNRAMTAEPSRSLNLSPLHIRNGAGSGPSPLHQSNDLRERVEMLESHNRQLEDYILQLTSLKQ
jgi:dystrophin